MAAGNPPLVVGLDTASDRWHAVRSDDEPGFCPKLTYTSKATAHFKDPDVRRRELSSTFRAFVDFLPWGTHVYCEEPLALQNGKTTRLLSLAAGALWNVATETEGRIVWRWVDVAHWKRVIVGNGNADKNAIRAWVLEHHDLGPVGPVYEKQIDLYDAKCLLQYGLQWLREGAEPARLAPKGKRKKG